MGIYEKKISVNSTRIFSAINNTHNFLNFGNRSPLTFQRRIYAVGMVGARAVVTIEKEACLFANSTTLHVYAFLFFGLRGWRRLFLRDSILFAVLAEPIAFGESLESKTDQVIGAWATVTKKDFATLLADFAIVLQTRVFLVGVFLWKSLF